MEHSNVKTRPTTDYVIWHFKKQHIDLLRLAKAHRSTTQNELHVHAGEQPIAKQCCHTARNKKVTLYVSEHARNFLVSKEN